MIPMFPFSINNALKLFTNNNMDTIDEEAIKERITQAVIQSLPNRRTIKFNAIVVLECDNEPKRTIVMNETINTTVANSNSNGQKMQLTAAFPSNSFTTISTNNITNPTNLVLSQQPMFPATMEGLQAILNLTSATMNNRLNKLDNSVQNNFSFIPMQMDGTVKANDNNESGSSARKRKSEKPCRIPQYPGLESNGLDLTLTGRNDAEVKQEKQVYSQDNGVPIWPCPVSMATNQPIILPRPRKPAQLPGHKKSSKVFNCNQCKLQFNSLNALCKHTFSDHRAFRCTFCSANFTQRSNLQRHSLKHVGFKPFICNVCSKAYYRKDHLVRHIEVSHPGSDPKSNITVKLSSSECLEYLEKMQNNKLMEMDAAILGGENNHFLSAIVKSSPLSGLGTELDTSPVTMAQDDDARDLSPIIDGSESPDKLQISLDDTSVKAESRSEDMEDYPSLSIDVPLSE